MIQKSAIENWHKKIKWEIDAKVSQKKRENKMAQ